MAPLYPSEELYPSDALFPAADAAAPPSSRLIEDAPTWAWGSLPKALQGPGLVQELNVRMKRLEPLLGALRDARVPEGGVDALLRGYFDGDRLTTGLAPGASVAGTPALAVARASAIVFREPFDSLPDTWSRPFGTGTLSLQNTGGRTGGRTLRVTGEAWLVFPFNLPFDPATLYRLTARFRQVSKPGGTSPSFFYGLVGVAEDGVTLVSVGGVDSASDAHYHGAAGLELPAGGGWSEAIGWTKGNAAGAGTSGARPDARTPGQMNVGVRYVRPIVILNYQAPGAVAEVDFLELAAFDQDAAARLYAALTPTGRVQTGVEGTADISGTLASNVASAAARALLGLDGSGQLTTNVTGTVGGRAASVLAGAVDAAGNLVTNVSGTVGGLAATTITTGASRAVAAINAANALVTAVDPAALVGGATASNVASGAGRALAAINSSNVLVTGVDASALVGGTAASTVAGGANRALAAIDANNRAIQVLATSIAEHFATNVLNDVVAARHIAGISLTVLQAAVAQLSALSANIGTVTAGRIQNAANTRWWDLNASGTQVAVQLGGLQVLADGTTTFGGNVTGAVNGTAVGLIADGADRARNNIGTGGEYLGTVGGYGPTSVAEAAYRALQGLTNTGGVVTIANGTVSADAFIGGRVGSSDGVKGINFVGTLPGAWTSYLDLAAVGAAPFLKHGALELRGDGSGAFGGDVTGSSFTSPVARFGREVYLGRSDSDTGGITFENRNLFGTGSSAVASIRARADLIRTPLPDVELWLQAFRVILGGSTSQRVGFYGTAGSVQQTLAASPTTAAIRTVLVNLGLVAP